MTHYDAIIIGGGLGGLTAGAKLAKEGRRVLLVEQHAVPGGCATTFKRKDLLVEVGLHEMDGLDDLDPKNKIFRELEVHDGVELLRVPEFYRMVTPRVDLVIPHDPRQAIERLVQRFPGEERGIRRFFRTIINCRKEIYTMPKQRWKMLLLMPFFPLLYPNVAMHGNRNIGEYLDRIIEDEDLKQVLTANLGYYHDNPYTMSMLMFCAAQASYFVGGGYFVKGGSQRLSDHLAAVIRKYDGEVVLRHLVTEIIVEGNRAVGIRFRRRTGKGAEIREARARHVIANAAIPNVVEMLPPCPGREKLRSRIQGLRIGPAILSVYLGFSKPPRELGNTAYSTFINDVEDPPRLSDFVAMARSDLSRRPFVFVDYSQLDSGLAPPGKAVGVLCTFDYLDRWEGLDREAYRAQKDEAARLLLQRLERVLPGLTEQIEYQEVATAKTLKRFTLNPGGTAYGYAQIPSQTGRNRVPQRSPVEGLYFASAWTVPSHGFSGAIMSGYLCATKLLGART